MLQGKAPHNLNMLHSPLQLQILIKRRKIKSAEQGWPSGLTNKHFSLHSLKPQDNTSQQFIVRSSSGLWYLVSSSKIS